MKIKKLVLENYLCYYGKNEFIFKDGLNLILGRNGEGKTKFFEAIEWLFNSTEKEDINLASARRIHELKENEKFTVKVSLVFERFNETAVIDKSFDVRINNNEFQTSNYRYIAYENKQDGSRIQIDGEKMLERLFPAQIRRYSMFKGESELNIFDDETALKKLIDTFSEVKHYPPLLNFADNINSWFQTAMDKTARTNDRISREVKRIQFIIDDLQRKKSEKLQLLKETQNELNKASSSLSKVEKNSKKSEIIKTLNKRIEKIDEKISHLNAQIDESYSTFLLDEKWLLFGFEDIYNDFSNKISELRKIKNLEEKKHNKEIAKKEAKEELLDETTPLPWFIPDEGTMTELVKEKICKVCGRPAPEGSEALKFMKEKLEELLNRKKKSEENEIEEPPLFLNDYIDFLIKFEIELGANDLNIKSLKKEIGERLEFNRARKEEKKQVEEELENETDEKNRILAESTESEYDLMSMHSNIIEWTEIVRDNSTQASDYENEIKKLEEQINEQTETKNRKNAQVIPSYEMNTLKILKDIRAIFFNTKERLLNDFIARLEEKANQFIALINVDDFTGRIKLYRRDEKIYVQLINRDGTIIRKPHGSLETTKHISVLFGISELATETKQESFPMFFDAPTSSFDPAKVLDFYNLLYETKNQRIIATKDFTSLKEDRTPCVDENTFAKVKRDQAYWITRERPFDKEDLSTINTQVVEL